MDFFQISTRETRGIIEASPDFIVGRSNDFMVRSRSFYAIWDEQVGLWSTDEYDVQRLVDAVLDEYAAKHPEVGKVKHMRSFSTNGWNQFRKFMNQISDNSHQLDQNLTFANTEVKKSDYVSRRLPYSLADGDHSAWDEIVGTLYSPEEREKIEWGIGAIVSGDAKKIQKFFVLYGSPGTGKGTILEIIAKMFAGYVATFEAKELVGSNNGFALEMFKDNPLVAIQGDGDLSRIEDNTKLNSIVSHEPLTVNEKYKPKYTSRFNAMLFLGTNKPVKITDAKSGIIRRLIDVHPSGVTIPTRRYHSLISKIDFELGAIAKHCLDVYLRLGKNYYSDYRPVEMMFATDIFYNFIDQHRDLFETQGGITLRQAYSLYKEFCSDTGIEKPLPQYKFRTELRNYFKEFDEKKVVDDTVLRSYFSGFSLGTLRTEDAPAGPSGSTLVLEETVSLLDRLFANQPAQYAKDDGSPEKYWTDDDRLIDGKLGKPRASQVVSTVLSDLDTSKLHFVQVPENHIVIDFDLKGDDGGRDLERNRRTASDWPVTYAEYSKSGRGIHLHYIYTGDTSELDPNYADGIEIKVFNGNASLRRLHTRSSVHPVTIISGGLPLKEKKVLQVSTMQSERGLRELIERNLRKEIHPGTKPSIDFIQKILQDAYDSDMQYDVEDLRPRIIAFANNSTNQPLQALKIVNHMQFKSKVSVPFDPPYTKGEVQADKLVFFDVEVYPNLFVVCWKYQGDDNVVRMINPGPQEMEGLMRMRLVGFYNRDYDNHIIYARYLGYTLEQLYKLSKRLIDEKDRSAKFGEAFNISYADIHEFSSVKMGLKKWQIKLGIHHQEMDIPWDQPVPEDRVLDVVEYCVNDVISEEVVFEHRKGDYIARQILAELSGLAINDTTQKHTARIIFGNDRRPQESFVYTDLSKEFPSYVYDGGKSTYRGEIVGEGGYVYAEPGMYEDVVVLDVASMHPTSINMLDLFGEYTPRFVDLLTARLAVKREDYETARTIMGGKLAPYLEDKSQAQALSDALKIVINIVYGLTSAKFDNPFRDNRNKDNIVAKRGALFMIDLKHAIQELGFTVVHIKTDSVKIPNATEEVIRFVKTFGEKYGYTFEYDPDKDFYDKLCLVNDAVYIARKTIPAVVHGDNRNAWVTKWDAVGAQFAHSYVHKALFTREPFMFSDYCEAKQVTQGAMYIDFDIVKSMASVETPATLHFIGRTGLFVPVKEGYGGGILYRVKDGKAYAVTGTKGYLWAEAKIAEGLPPEAIDVSYFENLAEDARKAIDHFGSFTEFVS